MCHDIFHRTLLVLEILLVMLQHNTKHAVTGQLYVCPRDIFPLKMADPKNKPSILWSEGFWRPKWSILLPLGGHFWTNQGHKWIIDHKNLILSGSGPLEAKMLNFYYCKVHW